MRRLFVALTLALVMSPACQDQDKTKIVVAVWSDLDVPAAMNAVRIDVARGTETRNKKIPLTTKQFPVLLDLVPRETNDTGFTVTAVALKDDVELFNQKAIVKFKPGKVLLLKMTLDQNCRAQLCGEGTCRDGACVFPVPTLDLPPYDPKAALLAPDSGVAPDANADGDAGGESPADADDADASTSPEDADAPGAGGEIGGETGGAGAGDGDAGTSDSASAVVLDAGADGVEVDAPLATGGSGEAGGTGGTLPLDAQPTGSPIIDAPIAADGPTGLGGAGGAGGITGSTSPTGGVAETTSSGGVGGSTPSGGTSAGGTVASAEDAGIDGPAVGLDVGLDMSAMPLKGTCDILEEAGTPCVGAYSMVRALYRDYGGPVYQVRSKADTSLTQDVQLLAVGGVANSKIQDDFCTSSGCTISKIYDQSNKGNHLVLSPDTFWLTLNGTPRSGGGMKQQEADVANSPKITVGAKPVYGLKVMPGAGNAYRLMAPQGTAVGDEAETIYTIVDTSVYNNLCCFDFGNAESTGNPDAFTSIEAISYGNGTAWGKGGGNGPWLSCDYEVVISPGATKVDLAIPSINISENPLATFLLKGFSGDRIALKYGNAIQGPLAVQYDGQRARATTGGAYTRMKKQGSIVLGSGGDGSAWATGVWFEGAITFGCSDDATVDDALQANIVAAGFHK